MRERDKQAVIDISKEAGSLLKSLYGKPLEIIQKGEHDYATGPDIQSEILILNRLKKENLRYKIIAEEKIPDIEFPLILGHEGTMYVDPLEGTHNFRNRRGHYGVTLAVEENGKIVFVVFYYPEKDETYIADVDKAVELNSLLVGGASVNGEILEVSHDASSLDIYFNDWPEVKNASKFRDRLRAITHYPNSTGSDAVDLAMTANGNLVGEIGKNDGTVYVFKIADTHDLAPALLVRLAGGYVTNLKGGDWYRIDKRTGLVIVENGLIATEPQVYSRIRRLGLHRLKLV